MQGDGAGCNSNVGRIGGPQKVNLNSKYEPGKGCFRKFTIAHELIHTLGNFLEFKIYNKKKIECSKAFIICNLHPIEILM